MIDAIVWTPGVTLDAMERQIIKAALNVYSNNKTRAADALGISTKTIDNKLERYAREDQEELENEQRRKFQREQFLARARGGGAQNPIMAEEIPPVSKVDAGLGAQPIANVAEEQSVSMSERTEVQKVLPSKTAASGHRGRRS